MKFENSSDADSALKTLKEKLITPPILAYPNFKKPFLRTTDATNVTIGSVLSQIGEDSN